MIYMSSVTTKTFPMLAWMCTQVYLLKLECEDTAWSTLTRFIACGGGARALSSCHPLLSMVRTCTQLDGALEDCVVVSIENLDVDGNGVMYRFVFGLQHGDISRDVPISMVKFMDPDSLMTLSV